ncbi:acyltransferase [Flavobacteriales bacterium]|nr:acyltransferase [Flavobacteriales bacterium]
MKKIFRIISNHFLKLRLTKNQPQMIYGYQINGVKLPLTRVGSHTTIVGKKNLTLANDVFIGQFNFIESSNGLEINTGCQITNYISILSHSSHQSIRLYGSEYRKHKDHIGYRKGKVKIGQYTFIGPHCTIMPSTEIGKGSLVSAYSLLKGTYPDFAIISGNPAVVVGDTREADEALLEKHPELRKMYDKWAKEV